MKGGKPNEPENKAALRLKAFNDSRSVPHEENIRKLKKTTPKKANPSKSPKKKK